MYLSSVSEQEINRIRALARSKGVDLDEDSGVRTYGGVTFKYSIERSGYGEKVTYSVEYNIIHKSGLAVFLTNNRIDGWVAKELLSLGA